LIRRYCSIIGVLLGMAIFKYTEVYLPRKRKHRNRRQTEHASQAWPFRLV